MEYFFETSLDYLSKKDSHTYKLFLLHLKLYLEEIEEAHSRKFKDFEIIRLEKTQELDTIVLEGYCSFCRDFYIVPMKSTDYLNDYINSYVSKKYISSYQMSKM